MADPPPPFPDGRAEGLAGRTDGSELISERKNPSNKSDSNVFAPVGIHPDRGDFQFREFVRQPFFSFRCYSNALSSFPLYESRSNFSTTGTSGGAIDCGAIPKELAASEFFGHKKGSFTGAIEDKVGAFIEADGGTIFLDEIGNLSYDVQVQLLRVLQERRVKPIGTTTEVKVDVRLIAATNEDLKAAIKSGAFREDLYHRINEFTIYMPHLCERGEDIPLFANFFLDQANRELEKPVPGFLPEAMERISQYTWPGNLREMRNTVMRAALLAQGNPIRVEHLGIDMNIDKPINILHDPDSERTKIVSALQKCSGNKSKAAAMLGIDRKTLYNKLKLYQIE